MIVGFTGSAGWKHYYKKSKLSFYSVLSGQGFINMDFSGFLQTTISFSLEYNLSKRTQVKIGGMGLKLQGGTVGESGYTGVLPFLGLNFRF